MHRRVRSTPLNPSAERGRRRKSQKRRVRALRSRVPPVGDPPRKGQTRRDRSLPLAVVTICHQEATKTGLCLAMFALARAMPLCWSRLSLWVESGSSRCSRGYAAREHATCGNPAFSPWPFERASSYGRRGLMPSQPPAAAARGRTSCIRSHALTRYCGTAAGVRYAAITAGSPRRHGDTEARSTRHTARVVVSARFGDENQHQKLLLAGLLEDFGLASVPPCLRVSCAGDAGGAPTSGAEASL
jgi:hypothetical protein